MKIIIDTNLWISFLIGKQTFRLKELLTRKETLIFVCRELLDELVDVASRPKLKKYISQEDILQLLQVIELYCIEVVLHKKPYQKSVMPKIFICFHWLIQYRLTTC